MAESMAKSTPAKHLAAEQQIQATLRCMMADHDLYHMLGITKTKEKKIGNSYIRLWTGVDTIEINVSGMTMTVKNTELYSPKVALFIRRSLRKVNEHI